MPVFWLSRSKLRKAICKVSTYLVNADDIIDDEAATDSSAYDKVYDIIAKQPPNALTKAFDIVLKAIEDGWQRQQPQEQFSRKSTSNRRESTSNGGSSTQSTNDAISPADIKLSTDLLQVFHGIVHSFPREASQLFGDITHATRLLACVRSSVIPLDVRLVLVSLASRWYVLLRSAPQAAKYLGSVVDSFYNYTGLSPSLSFLLLTPHNIRKQQGWPYPPLERTDDLPSFMYVTPNNRKTQQGSHSRGGSGNARHNGGISSDRGSGQSKSSRASKHIELNSEQLDKMDTSAQELTSLGGMLIDNLVTLPIDEDPQSNRVIQDMLKEVNRLNSLIANHISSLTSEHTQTTRRLKLATDETKRCHWVYKDTIAAFEEWKYKQQDYATLSSNRLSMALASGGAGSSSLAQLQVVPVVLKEMPVSEPAPVPAPVPLERISTKAKGKMPDTAPPPIPPRT
ncbi:hypothetical protein GGH94_001849 [Coemansia aciculifera]|uniref:Uncharacterized protein n=1 Tax=Coemansia aciculifera TaxID=417176 RepID=A0A9W8M7S6_9FUNG|nr:hypothetical protein GGH94_001849 [Coemansia aciculifera]